jgi:O-methyltransferase involved in polyketide biosynthesis
LKQGRFRRTAYKVAIRRAARQFFDQPKVLDDPLAVPIIRADATEKLRASPDERQHPVARAFRTFMAARSRYAEYSASLRVFEAGHPATQAWKLTRLQGAAIAIPPSLKLVPVDFERQTLAAGLEQGGFDSTSPAFFSWLGVTPYLTRESCMATLRFIAQLLPGSGVAFDFAVDPKLLNLRSGLPCTRYPGGSRLRASPFNSSFVQPNSHRNSGTWDSGAPKYWARRKSTLAISRTARTDRGFGAAWDSLWGHGCQVMCTRLL